MTVEHLNSGEILSQATVYNGVVNVCGLTADDMSLDAKGQTEQILAKIEFSKTLNGEFYESNLIPEPSHPVNDFTFRVFFQIEMQ